MKHPISAVLAMLPAASRSRLEGFGKDVVRILGPDLVHSVVVYGSAVRGGLTLHSDVDVLLVLKSAPRDRLEALHDVVTVARAAARLDVRCFTLGELSRAADVFPIFFDDVKDSYSILQGEDAFAGLVVHGEHRRLQVEQQLREHQLLLRDALMTHAVSPDVLVWEIRRQLKVLRAAFSTLARLHDPKRKGRSELAPVLDALGARYRLDTQPLTSAGTPASVLADTWQALLTAAIVDVDTLTQPVPPSASPASGGPGAGDVSTVPSPSTIPEASSVPVGSTVPPVDAITTSEVH